MRYAVCYARWSSGEQGAGDSRRRQDHEFTEFCRKHMLEPLPGFDLEDDGVSGYRGANLKRGSLADFLLLVRSGQIPKGTVLCVENQDRLSRDDVDVVLRLFMDLVAQGIGIGDCLTNRIVDSTCIKDPMVLMTIIMGAVRANEYAASLGRRSASNWSGKRERAATEKMTSMCPHWLKLTDDRKGFQILQERAAVVRLIFSLACSGKGCKGIVDALEERGINSPEGLSRWHPNLIVKLLKDRSVLGEFQPCQRVAKHKSVAVGAPVPDYFPAIISPEDFDKANTLVTSRNLRRAGRTPERVNVFAGLLFDAVSGSPFHVVHRYPATYRILSPKYGKGGGCISYEKTVEALLLAVQEIDPTDFADVADDETTCLIDQLAALDAKLAAIKARMKQETDINYLMDILRDLTKDRETIKTTLDTIEMIRRSPVKEAVTSLQATSLADPEFYRARLRLAVEKIRLHVEDVSLEGHPWKRGTVQVCFRRGVTRVFRFEYRNRRGYLKEPVRFSGSFTAESDLYLWKVLKI